MAEAIVNNIDGTQWQAYSAGTQPAGFVHPKAIQVLAEVGIQHQGKSKSVDQHRNLPFSLIVTVCDSAAEECPILLGQDRVLHHSFPDPAQATGTEEEVLNAFRQVRDEIITQIPILFKTLDSSIKCNRVKIEKIPLLVLGNQGIFEGEHSNVP